MTYENALQQLSAAFRRPLPGHDGFLRMSGYPRPDLDQVRRMVPPPRESAVLAMIYPKGTMAHLMLMVRPQYDGVHSGQIAFPGGRREEVDATLEDTALREFREETGASTQGVTLLGSLSPVYIPPSRSLVTPYVGSISELGPLMPDPHEVEALIEAPLELLLRDDILKKGDRYVKMMERTVEVPYFDVQGHIVWGATAMMIAELRDLFSGQG